MNIIEEWLSQIGWFNIISLAVGIIGIYLAFRFKKEKKPRYSKKTNSLIQKAVTSLSNLEVKYNNILVSRLTITTAAFWNAGELTIHASDIAKNDPLIIKTRNSNMTIYGLEVVGRELKNNFQVTQQDENTISILFDFIDKNEGVIVNVIHNGEESSDILITGNIIGAGRIKEGVRKNYLMDKLIIFDLSAKYINYFLRLSREKNVFIRLASFILIFPVFFVMIFFAIAIMPISLLYEAFYNRHPKKFILHDYE